jgi:DNA polymerase-3 subunit delta
VIVVKDAHVWNEQQVKTFAPYWEEPSTSTCLIFLGEKLGSWKRWVSVLEEKGRVVSFTHPRGKALTRYIIRGARGMGKEISVQAAEMVMEQVGNNLGEIYQELDKIASYVGDGNRISLDDVEAVISPVRSHTVFDLTRAMGMKNCPEALKILNQMMEGGENHLKILTMMVRQFRLIWMAKDLQSQGMPRKDIGKALGVPEFVLRPLLSHVENFTPTELAEGYRRFSEADGALKSRSIPKGIVLENLIISLCQ